MDIADIVDMADIVDIAGIVDIAIWDIADIADMYYLVAPEINATCIETIKSILIKPRPS